MYPENSFVLDLLPVKQYSMKRRNSYHEAEQYSTKRK